MSDDRASIVKRLRSLPDAFDINAAELCRRIECEPNQWSQYVKIDGKRVITRDVANRLADEFNLTLDWIYRGKTAMIPQEVVRKLRQAA
jgi:transcriptional regulator with XRE-family HTH domain